MVRPDMAIAVRAEFGAKVRPLLLLDCGQSHAMPTGGLGPGFLAANPDMFTTVTAFPGLIGATAAGSRLMLKDAHVGPSYHATSSYMPSPELVMHAMVISDWITLYNQLGGLAVG